MSKLFFKIDKKHDLDLFLTVLRKDDPAGLENRAFDMDIPLELAKKVASTPKDAYQEMKMIVDLKYNNLESFARKSVILYQDSWDEINDKFFDLLENKTDCKIKFDEYFCTVSLFHKGISNWSENRIARIWSENHYTMRKITAHEIIVSHIFHLVESKYSNKGLQKEEIWKFAEISAWVLTGLDEDFLKFWPWIKSSEKWNRNHNYPQLVLLQDEAMNIYKNSDNFILFFEKMIEVN
jgi:hypothetical protein